MTEQEEFEFRHRLETELAAKPKEPDYGPTVGMSTTERTLAGIGQGMTKVGRAVASGVRQLGPQYDISANFFGLPNEADAREAARVDAPLLNTTAGKVGSFTGQVAAVAPTMLIPGANTALGATAVGGLTGAATTEGSLADRAIGGAAGAAGGFVANKVGDLVGQGINAIANRSAQNALARQTANAAKDQAAQNALAAGYKLPPTEVNPSMINSALEGLSGKIKTSQSASAKNQPITNELAKYAIGLPKDQPITLDALKQVRTQAGKAYDAVQSTGTITPGPAYEQALDKITAQARKAAQGFPGDAPNPLIAKVDALKSPQFDASSAVAKIKSLRADADKAYAGGDKELGKALKDASGALEDAIEAHLQKIGAPSGMLDQFRAARQMIAKTYSVEKALNPTTGDVSAAKLAAQLAKGKPLSNELKTIAEAGQAFPKATQSLQQNYNALSPLDYATGVIGGASGNPLLTAGLVVRPGVRSLILSKPYQNAIGPSYTPNALATGAKNALDNEYLRRLLPGATAVSIPTNQ